MQFPSPVKFFLRKMQFFVIITKRFLHSPLFMVYSHKKGAKKNRKKAFKSAYDAQKTGRILKRIYAHKNIYKNIFRKIIEHH